MTIYTLFATLAVLLVITISLRRTVNDIRRMIAEDNLVAIYHRWIVEPVVFERAVVDIFRIESRAFLLCPPVRGGMIEQWPPRYFVIVALFRYAGKSRNYLG